MQEDRRRVGKRRDSIRNFFIRYPPSLYFRRIPSFFQDAAGIAPKKAFGSFFPDSWKV
jgi:hypothetical protein